MGVIKMTIDLGVAIAVIGCIVGIGGWYSGHVKNIKANTEWQTNVDSKLDLILGVQKDVEELQVRMQDCETKGIVVDGMAKAFHKRVDDLVTIMGKQ